MSFGGSSTSFTLPHTHNQTLANDGGQLSQTLTDMNGVTLYSLITGAVDPQTAINTAAIATNATAIAGLTANKGKWSATNTATFRTSVIAGVQAGTIEEVT
jgi:hypothetical protein